MATSYNFDVLQGSELDVRLNVKDENSAAINLSGFKVRGVVKHRYGDTGNLLDLNPIIVSGDAGAGYVSGLIDVFISGSGMAAIPVGTHVYDIERYTEEQVGGVATEPSIIKLMKGKFSVSPEVTY
jgi:hypothetical protein